MGGIDRFACIAVAVVKDRGVIFAESSEPKPYGLQAIFKDLYGDSYAPLEAGGEHA
jgi:hypothetical protein